MARKDRPGNVLRNEIDAAVATAFKPVSPKQPEEAIALPVEVAPDAPAEIATSPAESQPPEAVGQSAIRDQQSAIPSEPLPARMLNEFVYCPRLFYYEFVEGVFVHNADTMRGAAIHSRVDSGSGAMPPRDAGKSEAQISKSETEQPETIHSRSVSLGSERLGVTAKIDLVETRFGEANESTPEADLFSRAEVCPVDYKAGAPREGEEGIAPLTDEFGNFRLPRSTRGEHNPRSLQFKRYRQKRNDDGGRRSAGFFRLSFPRPIRGPIALGHSCHFGLGLFMPVTTS